MIQLPRRSVTRFFIPLIDVLTLLFCIFLLMPMSGLVLPAEEEGGGPGEAGPRGLSLAERRELQRLRREKQQWRDLEGLRRERREIEELLQQLRHERLETLHQRFVVRTLQMGDDGRLFWYDSRREKERKLEITRGNVAEFLTAQKEAAGGKEVYFLLMYPRPEMGLPSYPLRRQREEYDEWFRDVPHGYDIPFQSR